MTRRADIAPVFVSGDTAAALCEVSRDTWQSWVKAGVVPKPAIDRGQIIRWHWPSVEARLSDADQTHRHDPFVQGAINAAKQREAKKGRAGAAA